MSYENCTDLPLLSYIFRDRHCSEKMWESNQVQRINAKSAQRMPVRINQTNAFWNFMGDWSEVTFRKFHVSKHSRISLHFNWSITMWKKLISHVQILQKRYLNTRTYYTLRLTWIQLWKKAKILQIYCNYI